MANLPKTTIGSEEIGTMSSAYSENESDMINTLGTPPPCYSGMQTQLLDFVPGKSITVAVPVMESYCNPAGSMQGGFITAAFDNAFGPLCLITTRTPNTTALYINTTYHRPIFTGDELTIHATVKSNGRTMVYMTAEGYNKEGRLVASAQSEYFILNKNKPQKSG